MQPVSIVGTGQIPVMKRYERGLREMGAEAVRLALDDAGLERPEALFLGNMLSDELQGQKHLAALIADEAGLEGVEAVQLRAATASGAAALRAAYLAVASGAVGAAVAAGVEKMSTAPPTPVLAKALDAKREVPDGATLIGQNARLMQWYQERYQPPADAFARFAVVAHENARHNANALFKAKQVTVDDVLQSRIINEPIRLFDCAPICDGAAAVVLVPTTMAQQYGGRSVRLRASGAATDRFRISDRADPLRLAAAEAAANKAFSIAGLEREDVSLFEPHDAFTIMTCLHLEASGFARPGEGWKLAVEGAIARDGRLPLTTMGGLKARGHPIGATALYQVCEIFLQLTGQAGANQVEDARVAFMQSVGGAGATVIAHLFSR